LAIFWRIISLGSKQKQLQVLPENTRVHITTALPLVSVDELISHSEGNPTVDKQPFKYFSRGWPVVPVLWLMSSHRWVEATNHLCKRIHAFTGLIREELHRCDQDLYQTSTPINYT
jgi:hypothetical protein